MMMRKFWMAPLAASSLLLAGCYATGTASTGATGSVLPPLPSGEPVTGSGPSVIPGQPLPSTPMPGSPTPLPGQPEIHVPLNPNLPHGIETSGAAPPAVSLVKVARGQIKSGQLENASASLDRALRIEPRNAWVWQALSQLHLAQKQPEQAESEAKKSNSLGKRNPYLEVENWRVIAAARAARGDSAGSTQAKARQEEIQQMLGSTPAQ
jgi:hypothetical protein